MDGRGGGQEGRVPHEEGAQGALGEERGALGRDVLTAPHAVVDLEVQGLVLLLDSGREKRKKEGKVTGKELGTGWWHPWGGGVAASSPVWSLIPLPIKRRQFSSRNIPELFLLRTWVKKNQLVQKLITPRPR